MGPRRMRNSRRPRDRRGHTERHDMTITRSTASTAAGVICPNGASERNDSATTSTRYAGVRVFGYWS